MNFWFECEEIIWALETEQCFHIDTETKMVILNYK